MIGSHVSDNQGKNRDSAAKATVPGFARGADAVTANEPRDPVSDPVEPAPTDDRLLGRFEIKSKLGEGGMGVVLLAVDPLLGRQVALKVLHQGNDDSASRRRLLREAQGIAQLVHENVIVVHEVGSHAGRDYVAMEYVKGTTLGGWQAKRTWREILEMYLRAGRGLAAAHAAGLVHRDFKPDNVLVGDDGRVRVTDFGLVASTGSTPHTATLEARRDRSELDVSLTATGSIMGTPRYMPPEQHRGEPVDARADQFSFCASLYEALYGYPPFAGESYAVLRASVLSGELTPPPTASDVPKKVSDALVRGLAHDRDARFPSMTELLDVLSIDPPSREPARRSSRTLVAIGVAGVLATGLAIGLFGGGSMPDQVGGLVCPPPNLDPLTVITPAELGMLGERGHRDAAALLAKDLATWRTLRQQVCDGDPLTQFGATLRAKRLDCLDGVMAHFQLFARALVDNLASAEPVEPFDAGKYLVDPAACTTSPSELNASPPTLLQTTTPIHREVMAQGLRSLAGRSDDSVVVDLVKRAASEPCALIAAHSFFFGPREGLRNAAERCPDEALRLVAATVDLNSTSFDRPGKLATMEAVAARLASPDSDVLAEAKHLRAEFLGDRDEQVIRGEQYAAALTRRGRHRASIKITSGVIGLRTERASADDVTEVQSMLDQLRAVAVKELGASDPMVDRIEFQIGEWMYARGQVADAVKHHRGLAARLKARPTTSRFSPPAPTGSVQGYVRDLAGRPVEGARVYASMRLVETAAGVLPHPWSDQLPAVSRADGSFSLPAIPGGVMIAEHDELRSRPRAIGDGVLVVEPTTVVRGRVHLVGVQPTTLRLLGSYPRSAALRFQVTSPVQADGSFELRVAREPLELRLVDAECLVLFRPCRRYHSRSLVVGEAPVTLELTASVWRRSIDVVVRSTVGVDVTNAHVTISPGRVASGALPDVVKATATGDKLQLQVEKQEHLSPELATLVKPGDLGFTVPRVPDGTASVCVIAIPSTPGTQAHERIASKDNRIVVSCKTFGPDDKSVVIAAPPWPRFD